MKRLSMMTLEELEDYEQELNDQEEVTEFASSSNKIQLYKEMYRQVRRLMQGNRDEYEHYLTYITGKLVYQLVHYGSYLKMGTEKDDRTAYSCLKDALNFEPKNPVASYRLGFLSYKERDYVKAASFFHKALEDNQNSKSTYKLTDRQVMNAHLYLANSSLYVAMEAHEGMKELDVGIGKEIPEYEFSALFRSLQGNEQYLLENAFYKITPEGKNTCSKEQCNEVMDNIPAGTLVLYFNDRTIELGYGEMVIEMSKPRGDIILHLLTKSSEQSPATRHDLQHSFQRLDHSGEVNRNTFTQAVNRLQRKLVNEGVPPFIRNMNYRGENSYYFDHSLKYIVMYRVDEEIE